jgi:hypothetical protein
MSRWDDSDERLARARILARYTDEFGGDVLAALKHEHEADGWTRD